MLDRQPDDPGCDPFPRSPGSISIGVVLAILGVLFLLCLVMAFFL